MRDVLFHFQPDGKSSLQAQLRQMLVSAILDGRLPAGNPLPSCRKLATSLGVARNTVVLVYQRLVDEGFLTSRERSGYYVNQDILKGRVEGPAVVATGGNGGPEWQSRFRLHPSTQRNIRKPQNWQDFRYPFIYGQIDPDLFPLADWRDCSRRALGVLAVREWANDAFTSDDPLLIEQIRSRLLPRRGVSAAADEILVTVGAQHALYLIAALLMSRDTIVGVEEPGYPDARNIFSLHSSRIMALPIDDQGIAVGEATSRCDYVYTTPSHQFPTTVTTPIDRRRALLEQADRAKFVVIEDDYDAEISFLGGPHPALKSLDSSDRVIYVASLSKTLAPGLRFGFMVGPRPFIREARAMRRLMLRHPPANNQRTIAHFLAEGHHDSLLRRLGHVFKERWQIMGDAIDRHLPDCRRAPSSGGTAYWIEGPDWLDARALADQAQAQGIVIEPGDISFTTPGTGGNCFRLGFSSIQAARIEPGLKALGDLIAAARPAKLA